MNFAIRAGLAVFMMAVPMGASAASLTFTSVEGSWQYSTPAVTGLGTDQIRWGTDLGQGQSGYDFVPTNGPFDAEEGESFVLGTFDHRNLPIRDTLLDRADLSVQFSVDGLTEQFSSVFSFDHLESFNEAPSCANGVANGIGVNVNGCADRVVAVLNQGQSQSFSIGGTSYVLDILGFQYGGATLTEFWTTEETINSAELIGVFRTVIPVLAPTPVPTPTPTPTPPQVPLPASVWFIVCGMLGLVMMRRGRSA